MSPCSRSLVSSLGWSAWVQKLKERVQLRKERQKRNVGSCTMKAALYRGSQALLEVLRALSNLLLL